MRGREVTGEESSEGDFTGMASEVEVGAKPIGLSAAAAAGSSSSSSAWLELPTQVQYISIFYPRASSSLSLAPSSQHGGPLDSPYSSDKLSRQILIPRFPCLSLSIYLSQPFLRSCAAPLPTFDALSCSCFRAALSLPTIRSSSYSLKSSAISGFNRPTPDNVTFSFSLSIFN